MRNTFSSRINNSGPMQNTRYSGRKPRLGRRTFPPRTPTVVNFPMVQVQMYIPTTRWYPVFQRGRRMVERVASIHQTVSTSLSPLQPTSWRSWQDLMKQSEDLCVGQVCRRRIPTPGWIIQWPACILHESLNGTLNFLTGVEGPCIRMFL